MTVGNFRPSVCIDAVFENLDPTAAIEAVRSSGIDAFEFWGWWDRDLDALATACDAHAMSISACCTKFVSLVNPAVRNDYLVGLEETIAAAAGMNIQTIISQVGDAIPGVSRVDQHQSLVDGLKAAAPLLKSAGMTLVIEPLNELVDHAGYYLIRSDEAFEIIDEVGSESVKVVFDIYHQQISEGHLIHNIRTNISKIGHFHAAGNPGRHELDVGEMHYPSIFAAIAETDYYGYVGLEYWPTSDASTGLRRVAELFS